MRQQRILCFISERKIYFPQWAISYIKLFETSVATKSFPAEVDNIYWPTNYLLDRTCSLSRPCVCFITFSIKLEGSDTLVHPWNALAVGHSPSEVSCISEPSFNGTRCRLRILHWHCETPFVFHPFSLRLSFIGGVVSSPDNAWFVSTAPGFNLPSWSGRGQNSRGPPRSWLEFVKPSGGCD